LLQFQPQGVGGVGETTGDRYRGTGATQHQLNGKVGLEHTYTYVNNFRVIGEGSGNSYLVHETYHITILANGTVIAYVNNFRVECR